MHQRWVLELNYRPNAARIALGGGNSREVYWSAYGPYAYYPALVTFFLLERVRLALIGFTITMAIATEEISGKQIDVLSFH